MEDDQQSMPVITCDLGLDEDGELGLDGENIKCRRLVQVPTTHEILAYGGSNCSVNKIVINTTSSTPSAIRAQHWDDEFINAVAISFDGKRVVIGNEVGEVGIYLFDDYTANKGTTGNNDVHPFCRIDTKLRDRMLGPMFDASIRDLQFYPSNSDWLAIATEGGMGMIDISDPTKMATRYLWDLAAVHHNSGIRSLSFHRSSNSQVVLASLSMDGRLCLWDVSDLENPQDWKLLVRESSKCIPKNDVGDILGADPWDQSCRPVFLTAPSNSKDSHRISLLALPGMPYLQLRRLDSHDTQIKMESFDQPNTHEAVIQGHIEPIATLATCPNSSYLISGGRDNRVVLWSIHQRQVDGTIRAKYIQQLALVESAPTAILWERNDSYERVLIACASGKLVIIEGRDNIIPKNATSNNDKRVSSLPSNPKHDDSSTKHEINDDNSNTIAVDNIGDKDKLPIEPNDDADLDDVQLPKTMRTSSSKKSSLSFVDEEATEDDNYSTEDIGRTRKETVGLDRSIDLHRDAEDDVYDDASDDDDYYGAVNRRNATASYIPEAQAPFGVSATPLDLARRYLCWNHIGAITLFRGDDGVATRNVVEITFTDTLSRRNITFTDNLGFILGTLGEDGAIFATDLAEDKDDDDGANNEYMQGISSKIKEAIKKERQSSKDSKPTGSTLYFNRFDTFANIRDKDWVLTLPTGERAVGCSCGRGWVAAITNRRFLRFFSLGGNQCQLFSIPGDPITMVGRNGFIATFYHDSEPSRDGTQKIGCMLMDATTTSVISKGPVSSISKGSSLLWAGFSNDHSLVTIDTNGLVSMMVCATNFRRIGSAPVCWEWVPMLDMFGLKKSSDDSFWPISVFDGKVVCVPLKGGSAYPDATRRPVTTTLGFRMPLAGGNNIKSNFALEELSIRAGIALHHKNVMTELAGDRDDSTEAEYLTLSAQVDKVTLKLFASLVGTGKLERALDLVNRLHLEKSFDIAMTIADSHRKLVDKIEKVKERKFMINDDDFDDYDSDTNSIVQTAQMDERKRISPDSAHAKPLSGNPPSRNVRPKTMQL